MNVCNVNTYCLVRLVFVTHALRVPRVLGSRGSWNACMCGVNWTGDMYDEVLCMGVVWFLQAIHPGLFEFLSSSVPIAVNWN